MMDIRNNIHSRIKLIIWDLDNTFWQGELSESGINNEKGNYAWLVKKLCDCGIVNSICSYNDFSLAQQILKNLGVWEYFVFPDIGFDAKGPRISALIKRFQLRADNVLFIDDEERNLREASFYEPELNTLHSNFIDSISDILLELPINDMEHEKLRHYKILEQRVNTIQSGGDNFAFLKSMDFRIELISVSKEHEERIISLAAKAHQLNYTKKELDHISFARLSSEKNAEFKCVRLIEKTGDNGIIGFYYLRDNRLIHFVFSCRVINVGVPQWIYSFLGCPAIEIKGEIAEVITSEKRLSDHIHMVKQESSDVSNIELNKDEKKSIYVYGGCNIHRCISYLALPDNYVVFDSNPFVDGMRTSNNSSVYFRSCYEFSEDMKRYCRKHFSNYRDAFQLHADRMIYDYAIFSFTDDTFMHIYASKNNHSLLISGKGKNNAPRICISSGDETDPQIWFQNEFIDLGCISARSFRDNLNFIRSVFATETTLVFVGESEFRFKRRGEIRTEDEIEQIRLVNREMRRFCDEPENNSCFVDINAECSSFEDFSDYIYHWTCRTSYRIAKRIFEAMLIHKCVPAKQLLKCNKTPVIAADGRYAQIMQLSLQCSGIGAEYIDIEQMTDEQLILYLEEYLIDHFFLDASGTNRLYNCICRLTGEPDEFIALYKNSHNNCWYNEETSYFPVIMLWGELAVGLRRYMEEELGRRFQFTQNRINSSILSVCRTRSNNVPIPKELIDLPDLNKNIRHELYGPSTEYIVIDLLNMVKFDCFADLGGTIYTVQNRFKEAAWFKNFFREHPDRLISRNKLDWKSCCDELIYQLKRQYGEKYILLIGIRINNVDFQEYLTCVEHYVVGKLQCHYLEKSLSVDGIMDEDFIYNEKECRIVVEELKKLIKLNEA